MRKENKNNIMSAREGREHVLLYNSLICRTNSVWTQTKHHKGVLLKSSLNALLSLMYGISGIQMNDTFMCQINIPVILTMYLYPYIEHFLKN